MGCYEAIRVLELSESIAASYGAMLLAELGADVVKVEPLSGDPLRGQPGFHVWNRSKQSVALDMTGEGRGVIERLAADADIIITDFLPNEATRFGLTYDDVKKINPAVIYCTVPPMGSRGPRANLEKNDDLVAAYSALMGQQWSYRGGPVYLVIPISSYGAALLTAGAIGAALFARQRSGVGQQVEVSWLAASMAMQLTHVSRLEATGETSTDTDMNAPRGGRSVVYRAHKASDGWIFLACASPTFARKLFIALDVPLLVSDPRYVDSPWGIPREHRPALDKLIAEKMSTKTVDEWLQILRQNDVPCAPILSREEFINDPQVIHNGMVVEVEDPELGKTLQMNVPVWLSLTPGSIRRAAPRLGEHNDEVLHELESRGKRQQSFRTSSPPPAPLSGVKVADLTTAIAGAGITRILADLGADVIKVEPVAGDLLRYMGFSYVNMNRGKRDIVINLKTPEGQTFIHRLIKQADILVMNFRSGVAERLNIDYETVRHINPRIIYYSATSFGSSGPYGNLPGFDTLTQALSGVMQAQGGKGQEPVLLSDGIQDHGCALQGLYAILSALFYRERTGHSQSVETCILNSGFTMQSGNLIFYNGKPAEPDGGRDLIGLSAVRRLYQAKDKWFMLSVRKDEQWSYLAKAIGKPDWVEKYPPNVALAVPAKGELALVLQAVFSTRLRGEWIECLSGAGVPCAPALTYDDINDDPQVVAEQILEIEDNPEWGRLWVTSKLVKFPTMPGTPIRRAPTFGQHTDEVLEELGYDSTQIAELRAKKVIQ